MSRPSPEPRVGGHFRKKVLEILTGAVIGVITVLILVVGSLFAVGSMGQVMRNKTMQGRGPMHELGIAQEIVEILCA